MRQREYYKQLWQKVIYTILQKFDEVLFINASEHFEKGKRQNFIFILTY